MTRNLFSLHVCVVLGGNHPGGKVTVGGSGEQLSRRQLSRGQLTWGAGGDLTRGELTREQLTREQLSRGAIARGVIDLEAQAILPIEQSIPRSTYIHPPAVNAAKGAF